MVNIGAGQDITIADLAALVAKTVGYVGKTIFDPGKPDGPPQKLLDSSRIDMLGWKPRIGLAEGLKFAYNGFSGKTLRGKPMKAVILAGGLGTRISEETHIKPKPMIEIGNKPVLWHIMKLYSAHGVNNFIICCGYRGYVIKEYFANYFLHMSDVTFDMQENQMQVHEKKAEPWRVTLVDTGDNTMTGGRLKRVTEYVKDEEAFCFTYGDGLSDVDISAEIAFHKQHGKWATVTAVQPPGRYGALRMDGTKVAGFTEKPRGDGGLINGGFFVLSPKCLDLIEKDSTSLEGGPLVELAGREQLMAFEHKGFWQPMDTLRDKNHLTELWESGKAPWKQW